MMAFSRCLGWAIAVLVLAGLAGAQENLDSGKTPAELYAQDCAICHKSPRGLAQSGGTLGIQSFLREHYTASREAAAAIAGYLRAVGQGPASAARSNKRAAKPKEKGKPGEGAAASAKGSEPKAPAAEQGKTGEADPKPEKPAEGNSDAKSENKSDTKPEAKSDSKPDGETAAAKKPRALATPDADNKPD